MTELGKTNPQVVALCADLIGSLKLDAFIKEHPERFFQCGIAEANMTGIAAGLTIGGKIPFACTFANFATGRVYDQIRQSLAYSNKNVKIAASHAGVTLGEDGATHQILEDIGLMQMLPNFVSTRTTSRSVFSTSARSSKTRSRSSNRPTGNWSRPRPKPTSSRNCSITRSRPPTRFGNAAIRM